MRHDEKCVSLGSAGRGLNKSTSAIQQINMSQLSVSVMQAVDRHLFQSDWRVTDSAPCAARFFSLCVCAALLTGCTTWQVKNPFARPVQAKEEVSVPGQSYDLQSLLSREPPDTLVVFSTSPWGSNLSAVLHEEYTAASGRNCRRLTLDPEGQYRPALVCRALGGERRWEPVRLLQIAGRPVIGGGIVKAQAGVTP